MKLSTESTHLDWSIRTVAAPDNPEDWKPGDPDRYFVRGVAELRQDGDRFKYTSDKPLTVDTEHIDDVRRAAVYHADARLRLQDMINRLLIQ